MQLHAMDENNLAFTCITREETEYLGLGWRTSLQVMRLPQSLKTYGTSFSYFPWIFGSWIFSGRTLNGLNVPPRVLHNTERKTSPYRSNRFNRWSANVEMSNTWKSSVNHARFLYLDLQLFLRLLVANHREVLQLRKKLSYENRTNTRA
jgi:hypothetical protein